MFFRNELFFRWRNISCVYSIIATLCISVLIWNSLHSDQTTSFLLLINLSKSIFHPSKSIIYISWRHTIIHSSSSSIFILCILIWQERKNIIIWFRNRVHELLGRIKLIDTERWRSLWKSHGRFSIVWLNWLEQAFVHGTILIRHSDCELRSYLHRIVETWLRYINISFISKLLWKIVYWLLWTCIWLLNKLWAKYSGWCFVCNECHFTFKLKIMDSK